MPAMHNEDILLLHYYRPHPKDGEGNVFTGVCLSTGAGSEILSRGYPSQACSWGIRVPQSGPRTRVPPRQDRGTSPDRTGYIAGSTPLEDFLVCRSFYNLFHFDYFCANNIATKTQYILKRNLTNTCIC